MAKQWISFAAYKKVCEQSKQKVKPNVRELPGGESLLDRISVVKVVGDIPIVIPIQEFWVKNSDGSRRVKKIPKFWNRKRRYFDLMQYEKVVKSFVKKDTPFDTDKFWRTN